MFQNLGETCIKGGRKLSKSESGIVRVEVSCITRLQDLRCSLESL